jgi:trehalose 6-phosphate phosphatase
MIYALSDTGVRALQDAASHPLLYAFDFDGTLAPISSDRRSVTVSPGMSQSLHALAKQVPCAIVSGRALADVAMRINGYVPHVIGNHGIESPLTPRPVLVEAEQMCVGWAHQLECSLAPLVPAGVELENKRYSLTVHFRGAQNPVEAGLQALDACRLLTPAPELITGKYSINILPPGHGKGPATLALMKHLGRTGLFYIGDDETDETVFALPDAVTMGIRVGRLDGSRAGFYLRDQAEVEELLRLLVRCLGGGLPRQA